MKKDEFQDYLYQKTGEVIEGAMLDSYYRDSDEYDPNEEEQYPSNFSKHNSNINRYSNHNSYNDPDYNELIFGDCIGKEVSDIFKNIFSKAKKIINDKQHDSDFKCKMHELLFNFQLFSLKSIMYILLEKGNEKGYKYKDF